MYATLYLKNMNYTIIENSLNDLKRFRADSRQALNWSSVFVLPEWMQVWWQVFGDGKKQYIRTVWEGDRITGIAPLMIKDGAACLIGGTDVCDYLDFIVEPGREQDFFNVIMDDLKKNGIKVIDLKHVRPDSTVLTTLAVIAGGLGYRVESVKEDVSL
jgi:CelD/BcsL family acetyltransferase involved in cellulose biosynthesis